MNEPTLTVGCRGCDKLFPLEETVAVSYQAHAGLQWIELDENGEHKLDADGPVYVRQPLRAYWCGPCFNSSGLSPLAPTAAELSVAGE